MILLIDLHERPMSAEAPKSRQFVDDVFDLFGEDGNYLHDGAGGIRPLMEGGRAAWRMLGRLRRKAYGKAGIKVEEPGENKDASEKEVEMDYSLPQIPEVQPSVSTCNDQVVPPAANAANNIPAGGFGELLLMGDSISEADEMGQDASEALKSWQGMEAAGEVSGVNEISIGQDRIGNPMTSVPMPMGNSSGDTSSGMDDIMDFDWGEWDVVFGRYTAVDGITGDLAGEWKVE
jgi:hypothetical protein